MKIRSNRFNRKRQILPKNAVERFRDRLSDLATSVRYGGNPEHKRNPGDFGLTPPAAPRRGKSLCDDAEVFSRAEAIRLLRCGFRRGLVDAQWTGEDWPKVVWAVTSSGIPLGLNSKRKACITDIRCPRPTCCATTSSRAGNPRRDRRLPHRRRVAGRQHAPAH